MAHIVVPLFKPKPHARILHADIITPSISVLFSNVTILDKSPFLTYCRVA